MKLHLINGEIINITRQNCGWQFGYGHAGTSVNWNINPIDLLSKNEPGCFVIGNCGSGYSYDKFNKPYYDPSTLREIIPIRNVIKITNLNEGDF